MGRITLRQAAQWCGGYVEEKYADVTFLGASNDTREIKPGQLFVALQGARDGNDFVLSAMAAGAAAALCTRRMGDCPAIYVSDTRIALGEIARGERQRLGMKVVGITGSVGKSTTKEMAATVLEGTWRVSKTPVNHNNDIGMPMAILGMPEDTQVAVLEMGMNHFREMAYLSSIARPDVAVIVNIGTMHIENLGTIEGIRQAKMEIVEGMSADGSLILNGDDTMLRNLTGTFRQKITYFGSDPDCAVRCIEPHQEENRLCFRVESMGASFPVEMNLEGMHYISDAMAAVSIGLQLGVDPENIRQRLGQFHNLEGRQEILQVAGYTVIKDCYNAGPESMAAALQVLSTKPGRRIAVLGDMLELGSCAQAEHYRIGRLSVKRTDMVLAYGPNAPRVRSGCLTGGMPENRCRAFQDKTELTSALLRFAKPGDTILFKGSHGMHMETVLEAFLADKAEKK